MVGFSKRSSSTPSGKSPHSGSYQVGDKTVQYEMKGAEYDSYTDVPYLNQKLEFTQDGSALLDGNGYSIMMAWEKDIMYETAKHLAHPNADFLNIGYGMGYIDRAVESYGCRSHYIIEIHQDVLNRYLRIYYNRILLLGILWLSLVVEMCRLCFHIGNHQVHHNFQRLQH